MRKWLVYGAIFISVYVGFVIAMIPANWIVAQLQLPKEIKLQNISGSVWGSSIEHIQYKNNDINKVEAQLSFWSLFSLSPSINVSFGDSLVAGPEGTANISGFFNTLTIKDTKVSISADRIAQQLSLPIPLKAHNYIDLSVDTFVVGKPVCQDLNGSVLWKKASVTALDEKVELGNVAATLSCEKGVVALSIDPKNDLGLTFTAYLNQEAKISGDGYLKPGDEFPKALKELLPFLGKTDNQGRYRLIL